MSDHRFESELLRLEEKASLLAREIFAHLTPMQKVQLSRHANRPYTLDYVKRLFTDWVELKGDRRFAEDAAIVSGLASFHGRSVIIVGHQKGRGTKAYGPSRQANHTIAAAIRAPIDPAATIVSVPASGIALTGYGVA
jgi:acetyl-CoA carboxylase alpha subunit